MLDQHLQTFFLKNIRIFQFGLLFLAAWFFFWAHIYEMAVWNKSFIASITASPLNVLLYSIAITALIVSVMYTRFTRQVSTESSVLPSTDYLSKENESLKKELRKYKNSPSNKIGIILLIIGVLLTILSILTASTTIAFIGLGLTFWGALFLFARPTNWVRSNVLSASVLSTYITVDRIISDLEYTGKPICIPSYPKDVYLPEHLAGLKEMVIFIPAKDQMTLPDIEELAKKQFLVKNPEGICIAAPGSELVNIFEQELRTTLTEFDQQMFFDAIPSVIVSDLELANNVEVTVENTLIHFKIFNSVYSDLYTKEQNLKSIYSIGCPLTNSIMCALAKITGKPLTLTKSDFSPDMNALDVWYQIVEG